MKDKKVLENITNKMLAASIKKLDQIKGGAASRSKAADDLYN